MHESASTVCGQLYLVWLPRPSRSSFARMFCPPGASFELSATRLGVILGTAFWGWPRRWSIGSFVVDGLGMKQMLGLAFLCHLVGTVGTLATPYLTGIGVSPYIVLCVATFLVGSAMDSSKSVSTPWQPRSIRRRRPIGSTFSMRGGPGGLMLGGLRIGLSYFLDLKVGGEGNTPAATMFGWQVKIALILIPMLIYGILFLFEPFPVTERVASGVSTGEMLTQCSDRCSCCGRFACY